jgi:dCTP deaminase
MYVSKAKLQELISENKLIIRPLLDQGKQVGEISIDFRLGTDFLVSFQGREAFIDVSGGADSKSVRYFFLPTRRRFGDTFLLHPNQTVLCSSLEYIKMPDNIFAELSMRSSYARLGLSLSTIVHAGYCGCFSIELTNTNNNPIKIRVGARIFQARFFEINENTHYNHNSRKYVCQVRPIVSRAEQDKDLNFLKMSFEEEE